ncbi:MAG: hypothetical protein JRC92_09675 [Deltaproteobacteria bacterium]|nr:hypothetical protein [Deltaproteobacteria bacterium]
MTQQIINYDEEMVGANHPTKSDTLNRGFLISHGISGGMAAATSDPASPEDYQYYWKSDDKELRVYDGAAWQTIGSRYAVGQYTGDGNATKAITGLGFQPTCLIVWRVSAGQYVLGKTDQDGVYAKTFASASYYLDDQIISLDADGFTVGDGTGGGGRIVMTANGILYTWTAWA